MMKKLVLTMITTLVVIAPVCGQTRRELNDIRREASSAARALKREGFKPIELGNIQSRLEKYFLKVNSGCAQVIGVADNCMSTNRHYVSVELETHPEIFHYL